MHEWMESKVKNLFPQLWRGSMDKEDGKYLVLHHSQKTTKAKSSTEVQNRFKVMIYLRHYPATYHPPFSPQQWSLAGQGPSNLPCPAAPSPPIWLHMQTHSEKLCAAASGDEPHCTLIKALCLKMYVAHGGLRADAARLSADYGCWPRCDRTISDISFIDAEGPGNAVCLSVCLSTCSSASLS